MSAEIPAVVNAEIISAFGILSVDDTLFTNIFRRFENAALMRAKKKSSLKTSMGGLL
jgi:hypothetical protein